MKPASNRAVQRKLRDAMAEYDLSGEVESMRQFMLWLMHDGNRPDLVVIAFAAVHINVSIECAVANTMKQLAEGN